MALATIADYEAITGTALDDPSPERTRVERLLALSESAVLAGAHGQLIEQGTITGLVVRPSEGLVYLPQRPCVSVTEVVYEGETLDDTGFRFEPGGDGRPALLIRRCDGRDSSWLCDVTVTYVYGWDPVPGQIIGMVVAMANSKIVNGAAAPVTAKAVGPFSASVDAADAETPTFAVSARSQATLDALCGVLSPTSVRVVVDR